MFLHQVGGVTQAVVMKKHLPAGRYLAQLVRRETFAEEQRGGVEFTFRIVSGEYAGELLSMRLWAAGRIERADSLDTRDAVEISVGHRKSSSGRRFTVIHDFRSVSAPTAADAVRGQEEAGQHAGSSESTDASGTFRPHPLLTEFDFEEATWWADGELDQPITVPLLDDGTAERVVHVARLADGQPLASQADAPDFSEADDDVDVHCWIVTRHGGGSPVGTRVAGDESSLPLPAAPEQAETPLQASLFRYTSDLPSYMAAHGQSVRGYSGLAWACWLPLRIMAVDDLDTILERACLIAVTCARLGVRREQIVVVNNWNIGLTLLIPSCVACTVPQVGYEKVAGHFAQVLADLACMHTFNVPMRQYGDLTLTRDPRCHARIDRRLYGPVAIHPAINSPDESGRLFAVAMSYEELMTLSAREIKDLAKSPRPTLKPTWRADEIKELVTLWEYAVEAEKLQSKRYDWLISGMPFVSADVFDWMHHGSDMESAPKRLFRAATCLLRLGCSLDAVISLLQPAAYLSGLEKEDVEWGIRCAARSLVPEGFYLDDDE